jgi:glycerol uptake facilitator-like aquaporin
VALILTFGPISGAHFNPAVTLADASQGGLHWRDVSSYVLAQIMGAFGGVAAAHLMFGGPLFLASRHPRAGGAQVFSEFVATFGLLAVIWGCARLRSAALPFAMAANIAAAYWFTASTLFADLAVTLARSATDTFAGIWPADVPAFILAQLLRRGHGDGAAPLACAASARRVERGRRPDGGGRRRGWCSRSINARLASTGVVSVGWWRG